MFLYNKVTRCLNDAMRYNEKIDILQMYKLYINSNLQLAVFAIFFFTTGERLFDCVSCIIFVYRRESAVSY